VNVQGSEDMGIGERVYDIGIGGISEMMHDAASSIRLRYIGIEFGPIS